VALLEPVGVARALSRRVGSLAFAAPVTHTYNPLAYARRAHEEYLGRYARRGCEAILLGMNPGPWGMVQTGVPFGAVGMVRDWLEIEAPVGAPAVVHPARPILGFACRREEVSGQRLWGWARDRFRTPRRFARRFFVWNYCPLAFFSASGTNLTPDKLRASEKVRLFEACDGALRAMAAHLEPRFVIGVGRFAEERARAALGDSAVAVGGIPHPSPASPAANRGWRAQAEARLRALGIDLP
jgi:single-strand selective monofunctional uracil DNA glycosylase